MRRWLAAVAVVALVGCSEPQLWEEKGFPSEEACYRFYGYTGGSISTSDYQRYNYYCGAR